jgi:pimeloyl-ACP methyl ester carboxylesterase
MALPGVGPSRPGVEILSRTVEIEGRHIHYLQAGTGRPVLLVHGIAASVVDWHLNIPALAEHFAVTAVDLPGFGDSDIPPGGLSMADAVPFLDAFLDALKIVRLTLVGNSMGGLICGHYAIARPERVERLLMIDPAGLAREISIHFRLLTLPFLGEWALRPSPNTGKIAAHGLFHDPARAPEAWLEDKVRDRGPAARTYLLRALRSGTTIFGLRQEILMLDGLRRLQIPTLVMWGGHDHVVPVRHLELVKAHLPHARVHVFPAAGHIPMLECPEEFNRLAVEFVSGNG